MSETPQNDGIWIVTDEVPQISIPDGAKGGKYKYTQLGRAKLSGKALVAKG